MGLHRFAACALALASALVLTSSVPAAESPPKHPRTHGTKRDSAAARQEREQREELERRVERLEQRYEMKEPVMPAEPTTRKPAP